MKVSSPVGDFPFEAERLGIEDGDLVITGSMGAWPARVEIGMEDIPRLVRLVPLPVLAAGAVLVLAALRGLLRSTRS